MVIFYLFLFDIHYELDFFIKKGNILTDNFFILYSIKSCLISVWKHVIELVLKSFMNFEYCVNPLTLVNNNMKKT